MQCCAATAQSLHLTSVTGKKFFLEFACNLRSHCFGEGTRVEHFSDFGGFCSIFEAAQPKSVAHGSRQPHKTKSSPFQRRSRDEDDLRKKNSTIGEPRRKRNIYPSGLGTPPESSLTF